MTLTKTEKVTEVIFKAAPGFNHRAAQRFYDIVMKMDDASAFTFMEFTLANMLEEDISKNLRAYQGRLDTVIKKRIEETKRATIRSVSKNYDAEQSVAFAQALTLMEKSLISKDDNRLSGGALADFNRMHPRGDGGRFKTKVVNSGGFMSPKQAKQLQFSQGTKKFADEKGEERHLSAKERRRFAEDYQQLANFLQAVQHTSRNPGDNDTYVTFKDLKSGRTYTDRVTTTNPNKVHWNPTQETIEEIETRPAALSAGGAYFGLTSALGGEANPRSNDRLRRINELDQSAASDFTSAWMRAGEGEEGNRNAARYDRITAGSQLLGTMSAPGSKAQVAARMAQFVGEHGPEAEAVIGPHARKTAYRYRGTSKTPDKQLTQSYNAALQRAKMENATDPFRRTPEGRRANLKRPSDLSPVQMAAARVAAERRSPTNDEIDSALPQVISFMRGKLPKAGLYNLQLASGNTPPSQGVLIDKNGKIVDEAVGFGDDHYLPFNLKKLKDLRGGQYVRTRSVGGPTAEDIYTGLMAGASQITVVSRSGTFQVTFAPDFKGSRRYNDKALRMTRRYEQILDAVQSEQVDREGVMDEMRSAITQEVREEYAGLGVNARDMRKEIDRRLDEYKADPELSGRDMDRIQRIAALRAVAQGGDRDAQSYVRQIEAEVAAEKEYKFRLNGPGYEAALNALAEQFPYYITTKSDVEANPERKRNPDKGYVEPGRNRPTAARAGLFGTAVNPGNKFSASRADFQGQRAVRRGGTPNGRLTPVEKPEEKLEAKPVEKPKSRVEEIRQERQAADAAVALRDAIAVQPNARRSFHGMDDDQFRTWVKNPANFKEFDQWANEMESVANATEEGRRAYGNAFLDYKVATGKVGSRGFDKALAGTWTARPMVFDGPAYKPEAATEAVMAEFNRLKASRHGVVTDRPLQDMTDDELHSEINKVGEIADTHQRYGDLDLETRKELAQGTISNDTRNYVLEKPENAAAYLETVQRVRALKAHGPVARPQVATNAPRPEQAAQVRASAEREQQYENVVSRVAELRRALEDTREPSAAGALSSVENVERRLEMANRPGADYDQILSQNQQELQMVDRLRRTMGLD